MSVLGLICARGGSKGVPGKNVRDFCGKPLIAWAIECAKNCPDITDVVVSTDDREIANVSARYGAEVPFTRPDELARDESKQIDAIAHAIRFLKENGREYEAVVLLQPTCPLRIPEDISGALALMRRENSDTVITVAQEEGVLMSILYDLDDNNNATQLYPASKGGTIRQNFKPLYKRCGIIYAMRPDYVLKTGNLYGDKVSAYVIPRERSFDIDDQFDWDLCEWAMGRMFVKKESVAF